MSRGRERDELEIKLCVLKTMGPGERFREDSYIEERSVLRVKS